MIKSNPKNRGVAVILALLLVSSILVVVTSLTAIFAPKIRLVAEVKKSIIAVYAAESGIEGCLYANKMGISVTVAMSNGSKVEVGDCAVSPVKSTGEYGGVRRAFEISF